MHNMKQKTMHIMMTFAFAFLMVATALIPMIGTEDSSAAYTESNPQTVTVHMRVGDTFVYTPSVNIAEGTTTYTLTGGAQDGVSFTDGTLTAAFAEAGTKTVTLKAHWESGTDGEYNNVAQDAYLKLDMIVDERLTVVDETPTKIESMAERTCREWIERYCTLSPSDLTSLSRYRRMKTEAPKELPPVNEDSRVTGERQNEVTAHDISISLNGSSEGGSGVEPPPAEVGE